MHPEHPVGGASHWLSRLDLVPPCRQGGQPYPDVVNLVSAECTFAFQSGNGRGAFDRRPPPRRHHGVLAEHPAHRRGGLLIDQHRHHGRAVPEPHRPVRRSSIRASTAALPPPFGRAGGGTNRSSRTSSSPVPLRTNPARSSRARRGSAPGASSTASSRATGTPRSAMTTVSPARTTSKSALRVFFASDTDASLIWL